jgi:hypothetical protein
MLMAALFTPSIVARAVWVSNPVARKVRLRKASTGVGAGIVGMYDCPWCFVFTLFNNAMEYRQEIC